MRIVVFGGLGMLGEELVERGRALGHSVVVASRSSMELPVDISDPAQVERAIDTIEPDAVINSAAIASVEDCEANPARAMAVNAKPVDNLAELSRTRRFKLVQISTDHFFVGDGKARHDEAAPVVVVNEYARSKLAAEKFADLSAHALTIRTAFVGRHSARNQGFAEQVHRSLRDETKIVLFEDAYTSLLHRSDLAAAVHSLIGRDARGVVNVASRDVFSKADLIRAFAAALGMKLDGQSGSVKSLKVPRADSLGLSTEKVEALLDRAMPTFEQTVDRMARDFRD